MIWLGEMRIPLPIKPETWIIIRDATDFDAFREVCLGDCYDYKRITKDMIVIDIGAHIGTFTLMAATRAKKVYAIEPSPHNVKALARNANINKYLTNIHIYECAIGDKDEWVRFYLTKGSGCNTLYPVKDRAKGQGDKVVQEIEVRKKKLDNIVFKVDFIKIDVEGAEMNVLLGAKKILCENSDLKGIISAYHYPNEAKEVSDYLKSLGFNPKIEEGIFTKVIL